MANSSKGKNPRPGEATDDDGDAAMEADDEDENGLTSGHSETRSGSNASAPHKDTSQSASPNSAPSVPGNPSTASASSTASLTIDVAAIVSETLRQLNQVPSSRGKQTAKEGSVAYARQIKKNGLSALPQKLEREWRV